MVAPHSPPELVRHQQAMMQESMAVMDAQYTHPLLWNSPKYSMWYAVGLLHRGEREDIKNASAIIQASVASQYIVEGEEIFGTFPHDVNTEKPKELRIYDTFDPNNALFFTLAAMIIDAWYSDLIPSETLADMRSGMGRAVKGDATRTGGVRGDNLYPAYSNAWLMRCVCTAYVGEMLQEQTMIASAETWTAELLELFDDTGNLSEFNSGTYTGVSLFALSLAQLLPSRTLLHQRAPDLISAIWKTTADLYNPTLKNLSGPWDRTYGYDMRDYCGVLGIVMAGFLDRSEVPLPKSLSHMEHSRDLAIAPMAMLTAPYWTPLIDSSTRRKFISLEVPRQIETSIFYPPYDKSPRTVTAYVGNGISAGGMQWDNALVGGPSINPVQFSPGVILWQTGDDNGEEGGLGWISYHPTTSCCSIIATSTSLSIEHLPSRHFPSSPISNEIRLNISSFEGFRLSAENISGGGLELPGLDLALSGSVLDHGEISLAYGPGLHELHHYVLSFMLPEGYEGRRDLLFSWKERQ